MSPKKGSKRSFVSGLISFSGHICSRAQGWLTLITSQTLTSPARSLLIMSGSEVPLSAETLALVWRRKGSSTSSEL